MKREAERRAAAGGDAAPAPAAQPAASGGDDDLLSMFDGPAAAPAPAAAAAPSAGGMDDMFGGMGMSAPAPAAAAVPSAGGMFGGTTSTPTLLVLPLRGGNEQLVVFEPAADFVGEPDAAAFCIAVRAEGSARIVGGGTLFATLLAAEARSCFPSVRKASDSFDGSESGDGDSSGGSESGDGDSAAVAAVMSGSTRPDAHAYCLGDDGLAAYGHCVDALRRDLDGDEGVDTFIVGSCAVAFVCSTSRGEAHVSGALLLPAWRALRARRRAGGAADYAATTVIALGAARGPGGAPHCFGGRTAHESVDFIRRRFASGSKTELVLPSASPHETWERIAALVAGAALRQCVVPRPSSSRGEMHALRSMRGNEALRTSRVRCDGVERIRWVRLVANRAPSTQACVCCIA